MYLIRSLSKNAYILVFICVVLISIYHFRTTGMYKQYYKLIKPVNPLDCYSLKVIDKMLNIQDAKIQNDSSIFFLDTSCNSYSNGKLIINPRQSCAVESAALMNPNKKVFLLFASPGWFYDEKTVSDRLMKGLVSYSNIDILHINLDRFAEGSPVENLWKSNKVYDSKFPLTHISDIFRLLLLWRYGGIYMDLDIIVKKTFETLPPNFAGAESKSTVNNDVIGFSSQGIGHEHVQRCLEDLSDKYDGKSWSKNGPDLFNSFAKRICNTGNMSAIIGNTCKDFRIFEENAFYPIRYQDWKKYFDENQRDYVRKQTKDSYIIHVWNKLSNGEEIPLYKDVPYIDIAREFCPETIRNLQYDF